MHLHTIQDFVKPRVTYCCASVPKAKWAQFCIALEDTYVTHLYVSEHVIDLKLKNKMRDAIRFEHQSLRFFTFVILIVYFCSLFQQRKNRKKHTLHCSKRNIHVIERCTNMWWNPINSIKHKEVQTVEKLDRKRKLLGSENPDTTMYWAEESGNNLEWKFSCICGEVCSSYEKHIFHPTGRQYECTNCKQWSHVQCMFGNISDEALSNTPVTLCCKCKGRVRRSSRSDLV